MALGRFVNFWHPLLGNRSNAVLLSEWESGQPGMSVLATQDAVVKLRWWERVCGRVSAGGTWVLQVLQFGCGVLRGGSDAVEWREDGKKFHSKACWLARISLVQRRKSEGVEIASSWSLGKWSPVILNSPWSSWLKLSCMQSAGKLHSTHTFICSGYRIDGGWGLHAHFCDEEGQQPQWILLTYAQGPSVYIHSSFPFKDTGVSLRHARPCLSQWREMGSKQMSFTLSSPILGCYVACWYRTNTHLHI